MVDCLLLCSILSEAVCYCYSCQTQIWDLSLACHSPPLPPSPPASMMNLQLSLHPGVPPPLSPPSLPHPEQWCATVRPRLTTGTTSITIFARLLQVSDLLSPSGDLGIRLVWRNLSGPDRSFLVRLLKSSSKWTKLSMRGPQLFSGWYQMILDVQTRFRLGSE